MSYGGGRSNDVTFPQILDEEINPTMNKLKEERSTYLEYQKVEREYEHLSKFCIAFKFVSAQVRRSRQQYLMLRASMNCLLLLLLFSFADTFFMQVWQ